MPEELDDFDSLFDQFSTEFTDDEPITEEEQELIEQNEPPKEEEEEPIKIKVPDSEEDFLGEETPEGDEDEPNQSEDEEDGSDYFKTVGEGLVKAGKLKEVPKDFKWTEESFLGLFDEVSKENAQASIEDILTENWGDEGIELFNDIFVKKVPIKEYLSLYTEEQDYSSLDLEKVGNQKLIVKAYLEEMGLDEDEIYEQIELLEEKEKLEEKATKYKKQLAELKASERAQIAAQAEAQQREFKRIAKEREESLQKVVTEAIKTKQINGIPLSVDDHKTLLPYMTAPAYRTANGQNVTQMEKDLFELRKDPTKWAALAKLLKEGLNITPIKNKGVDEKKEELFNFTKAKKVPTKDEVESQLDLLFKRKKK